MLLFCFAYLLIAIILDFCIIKPPNDIDDITNSMAVIGLTLFVIMLPYILLKVTFKLAYYLYNN